MSASMLSQTGLDAMKAAFVVNASGSLGAAIDYRIAADRTLVEAMRHGDERAVSELVARYRDQCVAAALRSPRVTSERRQLAAEDAAWDTMLNVLARLCNPGRPIPDPLGAYLINAVRHGTRQRLVGDERDVEVGDAEVLGLLPPRLLDDEPTLNQRDAERVAGVTALLSADEYEVMTWEAAAVPRSTIAEWIGQTPAAVADLIDNIRARAARVVRMVSSGAKPFLTKRDTNDLVTAFVTARPAAERLAVATSLRDFAAANSLTSAPTAVHRMLTRGPMIAAKMVEKCADARCRRVVLELCAFARENGYVSGPGFRVAVSASQSPT